jgi:hypothetical protein
VQFNGNGDISTYGPFVPTGPSLWWQRRSLQQQDRADVVAIFENAVGGRFVFLNSLAVSEPTRKAAERTKRGEMFALASGGELRE